MRLIDADALKELIDGGFDIDFDEVPETKAALLQMIDEQPTADAVERKVGKWIVYYECPKCGEITKDFTKYCPFCNADMREETEDADNSQI